MELAILEETEIDYENRGNITRGTFSTLHFITVPIQVTKTWLFSGQNPLTTREMLMQVPMKQTNTVVLVITKNDCQQIRLHIAILPYQRSSVAQ